MDKKKFYNDYINKKSVLYSIFFSRQPQYFSSILKSIIFCINYVFILYTVFSVIINIFYHVFALNIPAFNVTEQNYEEGSSILLRNNYNNLLLILVIILGFSSSYYQTMSTFFGYLMLYATFFFSFTYKIYFKCPDSKIYYGFLAFFLFLTLGMAAIVVYSFLYYFKLIGYVKFTLNELPTEDIIHEVKLRIDMAKMSFNSTLIRFGLHKVLRRFMFKKEDYYFMNMDKEKSREENERIKKIISDDCYSCGSKGGKSSGFSYNSDEQTEGGSTFDSIYSKLDNECEPLK